MAGPYCRAANPPDFRGSLPILRSILRLYDLVVETPDFSHVSSCAVYPRTLAITFILLTCDGSRGSPIVYGLILHMRQTLTIAINGRWHDGGPVRDQPSQQWFIGLTSNDRTCWTAGPYVDVDCYTFQSLF